ncbi:RNA-binding protein 45-like [Maniola hyperantus]|uniref:RNA-binding protein 45-like n=1 Tax=Aphantopus hyperantus TaxID=2795564 RepID=UPI00156A207A|nr:RNA-binding protein 45-like [Maniola hyperantus]
MMNMNNMRGVERKEETPPYSRLFVVCSKQLKKDDLRERFETFGAIEDLYIPKDRNTGESKGVAYVKYLKTSSAAAAIQDLHQKVFSPDNKPMKVMIAVNKNESPSQSENEDKYRRLFIKVPRDITESEVRQHFSAFGHVDHVRLQRDKVTDACKGFAYVQYASFYDAAKAFEECDRKYKPVFATPREDLKRSRNSVEMWNENNDNFNNFNGPKYAQNNDRNIMSRTDCIAQDIRNNSLSTDLQEFNNIAVVCSPQVPQKYISKLFSIVPGMAQCQYSVDTYNGISKALITYETSNSAAYALEKLNNFEFPSGEIITVKPDKNPLSKAADDLTDMVNSFKNAVDSGTPDLMQLANVIARASSLIKSVTLTTGHSESHVARSNDLDCNVTLPPPMPMADFNSKVAQRLFIICKPQPPPISILQDVFCRFGDLIQVSTIPNKTFGFVKYASEKSAREAINTLNGAIVSGIRLKVIEADEKPGKDERVAESGDQNTDYDMDSKRMKLDD